MAKNSRKTVIYEGHSFRISLYLIWDYGSEEIRILSKGLVADHDCTSCHHFSFDFCCDFAQFSHPITGTVLGKFSGTQTLRNIPKSFKVEKNLKGSLVSIQSPSPTVKIQIMGRKICLRCKGKTLLGFLFSKVCWHLPAMFCLITSSKLSRQ